MEKLRHGSLFSGIGGFDLAAEWMGWDNVFHCEWNEFGQKVLKHYWPNAETFTDITKTDFTKYYGTIDIISGGFPCQPYSSAGKRRGKEDERHLWPEMLRAIREVSPRFVVGENVRGLTNWNGGLVFDEVCAELESLGYQVAPVIIPACGVGAPHKRERIWFVAYNDSIVRREGREFEPGKQSRHGESNESSNTEINSNASNSIGIGYRRGSKAERSNISGGKWELDKDLGQHRDKIWSKIKRCSTNTYGNATNSGYERLQRRELIGTPKRGEWQQNDSRESTTEFHKVKNWDKFPTQSPVCSRNDGLSSQLDGITFPKWRNESIKAYGNAIVPQVAFEIFKALEKSLYL